MSPGLSATDRSRLLVAAQHHNFLHHAGDLLAADPGELETVAVPVDRMNVVAGVAQGKALTKAAREALASTDWSKIDAMTDEDLARQLAANPEAAPDLAPEIDVRAIRRSADLTQAQFADAYEFSIRTVQEWERGA